MPVGWEITRSFRVVFPRNHFHDSLGTILLILAPFGGQISAFPMQVKQDEDQREFSASIPSGSKKAGQKLQKKCQMQKRSHQKNVSYYYF